MELKKYRVAIVLANKPMFYQVIEALNINQTRRIAKELFPNAKAIGSIIKVQ